MEKLKSGLFIVPVFESSLIISFNSQLHYLPSTLANLSAGPIYHGETAGEKRTETCIFTPSPGFTLLYGV